MYCSCHICHIYGIWKSKEVGDDLKSSFGLAMQTTRGEVILIGPGGSHYVILLYWDFIVSLTGHCKRLYRIPLFPIFLLFYLFCIYCDWQGQKCKLHGPKIYEINSELTVISGCTHFFDTNTFTHNLTRIN